eukprot:10030056-Alexandrium_andersonii.AAC.1
MQLSLQSIAVGVLAGDVLVGGGLAAATQSAGAFAFPQGNTCFLRTGCYLAGNRCQHTPANHCFHMLSVFLHTWACMNSETLQA